MITTQRAASVTLAGQILIQFCRQEAGSTL
jgi:hypothetical protein